MTLLPALLGASLLVPVLIQAQLDPPPSPLLLTPELCWEQPLEGDPLRITVRLSSPAFESELIRQVLELEQGGTNLTPVVTRPLAASNWFETLTLNLSRMETDGSRVSVLPAEQWPPYLREQVSGTSALEERTLSRSREWLVPAAVSSLSTGVYSLEVSWDGRGKGVDAFLPPGGILQAEALTFSVQARATTQQESVHLGRLAFQDYMEGQYELARVHGQQASEKRTEPPDPESLETQQIVTSAFIRTTNLFEAARSLETMLELTRGGGEIEELALGQLSTLAPELRFPTNHSSGQSVVVQLWAVPGETYVVYSSADLTTWTAISTNVPTSSPTEIPLDTAAPDVPTFYHVGWMP